MMTPKRWLSTLIFTSFFIDWTKIILCSLHVILCSRLIWITPWLFSYLCGTFLLQLVSTTIGSVPLLILIKLLIFRKLFNDFCVLASVDRFQYELTATIITLPWSPYHIMRPHRGVRMFFLLAKYIYYLPPETFVCKSAFHSSCLVQTW